MSNKEDDSVSNLGIRALGFMRTWFLAALLPALLFVLLCWALEYQIQQQMPSDKKYRLAWQAADSTWAEPLYLRLDLNARIALTREDTARGLEPLFAAGYDAVLRLSARFAQDLETQGSAALHTVYSEEADGDLRKLLQSALKEYEQRLLSKRLADAGLPPSFIEPLAQSSETYSQADSSATASSSSFDFFEMMQRAWIFYLLFFVLLLSLPKIGLVAQRMQGKAPARGQMLRLFGALALIPTLVFCSLYLALHTMNKPSLELGLSLLRGLFNSEALLSGIAYSAWPLLQVFLLRSLALGRRFPKLLASVLLLLALLALLLPAPDYIWPFVPGASWTWGLVWIFA